MYAPGRKAIVRLRSEGQEDHASDGDLSRNHDQIDLVPSGRCSPAKTEAANRSYIFNPSEWNVMSVRKRRQKGHAPDGASGVPGPAGRARRGSDRQPAHGGRFCPGPTGPGSRGCSGPGSGAGQLDLRGKARRDGCVCARERDGRPPGRCAEGSCARGEAASSLSQGRTRRWDRRFVAFSPL